MSYMSILFYLCVCLVVNQNEAKRILAVFPTPSISHQVVFRPLVHELVKRGHEVVVITTDPAFPKDRAPENLTEIDIHDISYKMWRETIVTTARGKADDFRAQIKMFFQILLKILDAQLDTKEIQNLIQDKKQSFDLLLIEACIQPALIFSHIYKVPVIQVSSFGAMKNHYELFGAPTHPLIFPTALNTKVNNLTIFEKVSQLYNQYLIDKYETENKPQENSFLRKHLGKDAPTVTELSDNVHMLFLNIHPMFEGIRPVPPNIIYMGGMHQKPEKELPTDLKNYLDSSKNGVIYLSFGTNVDPGLLPPEKIQIFIKVFSKLPYDILWKWNQDELPGRTKNIKISKWLPQSDLLKHPKIKFFITQGGLQSTDEAITAGVPLVGIPILGDQWFNVEQYVYHKIGVAVNLESLTEEGFENSINTVVTDDSYRRNIIRLGELMRDEPMKPLERAVWWTEYVLRHGGTKHLRSPTANMGWAQYLELELVLSLLLLVFTIIIALGIALSLVYKYIIRNYLLSVKIKSA